MAGNKDDKDRSDDHDDDQPDEDDDLLGDDEDAEAGDDDDSDDGRESDDALVDRIAERLGDRIDRAVEQRVKGPLRGMRREIRQRGGADKDRGRKGHDDDEEDARPVADVRAARTVAREHLFDSTKFISSEERELAMDLVRGRIASEALSGFEDEDEVGRRVAREVSDTVTKLRKHYVTATKRDLRKRGALVDVKGQPAKGSAGTNPSSEWDKGSQIAKSRFGSTDTT